MKSRHTLLLAAIILVGLSVSIGSFFIIQRIDDQRIRESFERGADERYAAFKREIESDLQVLASIKTYYAVSREVRRSEFRTLTKPFLWRHPSIQALEWIPRIADSQRASYEARAKEDGFRNFQIIDRKAQGVMVRSPRRSEYYPVYFVEPYHGNEIALGYDLASNAVRKESLERSRDTGQMVASKRITLVQEKAGQFGFIVFDPIYGKDSRSDSIEERRKNLRGFALGVFRIGDILEKSYTYLKPGDIHTSLYEGTVPDNDHLLYSYPARLQEQVSGQSSEPRKKFSYRKSLNVAGQEWLMVFETGPHYIAQEKSPWSWVVLVLGVFLTGILSLHMRANIRRSEELSILNEQLRREFHERQQAEVELRQSEERYHSIFENAVEGIYQATIEGKFITVNPAFARMLGYDSPEELIDSITNIAEELYVDPGQRTELIRLLAKHGQVSAYEIQLYCRDRSIIWISLGARAVKDKNGDTLYLEGMTEDITKRKQAEEALRSNEEKYRLHFENVSDIIFSFDREFRILTVSPSLERVLGYKPEEFIGKPFPELNVLPPEYLEKALTDAMQVLAGKNIDLTLYEIIAKDGTRKHMEFSSVPLISDGQVAAVVSVARDITDRERAKEALRNQEERHRTILQTTMDGFWMTDLQGRLLDVNEAYCRMSGYSEQELLTMHVSDLEFNRTTDEIATRIQKVVEQGTDRFESRHRRKDGSIYELEISIQHRSADGGHLVGFLRDITDRKRAEDALRESEEKYRAIIENMQEGYHEVDIKGNFTFFNEAMCRIMGYEREELLGMNNRQYADEENSRKVYQVYNRVYRTGESVKSFEWQIIRKDGDRRDIDVSISLIRNAEGHPTGFRGIVRDITDRKRAEEELQRTLESLRKAVGTTIQVITSAVESRDPYTAGHQIRVADLARAIATEMGFTQEKIDRIRMAGSIHDIGKLSIPAEILAKPTKLTEIEFALIKEHSRIGYEILKDVESPWPLAEIVYQHHERMDGSGYPRNLKGDEILMEARIMAVADAVEAMASHRPYRPAQGIDAALAEIENHKGSLYDADVVDACLRLFREKEYRLAGA